MGKTNIQWTNKSWNPVTGCTKAGDDCANCYIYRNIKRLKANPKHEEKYRNGSRVTLHWNEIDRPRRWRTPAWIFVNSMCDLFHGKVPLKFIQAVLDTIRDTPQHRYQILTKRSKRLVELNKHIDWPANAIVGVSVGFKKYKYRIADLKKISAPYKFLSLEPLCEDIGKLNLNGIDWVVTGGETGPKHRPFDISWGLNVLQQCKEKLVAFFHKSNGGTSYTCSIDTSLGEKTYTEMPNME